MSSVDRLTPTSVTKRAQAVCITWTLGAGPGGETHALMCQTLLLFLLIV